MANGSKTQTAPSNGAISGGTSNTTVGVNRKKAKRRAKQAAKQAAEQAHAPRSPSTGYPDTDLADPGQYAEADVDYHTEDDDQNYSSQRTNGHHPQSRNNGHGRGRGRPHLPPLSQGPPPPPPPPFSQAALKSVTRSANSKDKIWNTSTQEERENIKEFWLSLGEDERKSLVKIEKEAVLRKMKEQQKHSCSCTVCGRKRTAIEEELEVLYDAYYEELEQYANHQQGPENGAPILPPSQRFGNPLARLPPDRMPHSHTHHHSQHRVQELVDDEDEEEEEEEEGDSEEDYDEEDYDEEDEEEEINDEEINDEDIDEHITRGSPAADFFNFGNSLTVKGGILTVADDLLKNDGKKFIEMMEQLAERRMQREEQAQYRTDPHLNHSHNHGDIPEEDFDEEEEEEEYDDSEGEDYGEDEMDSMTEEQRMEEGRRMFQIFAARMFEQRVLTAYREKVAHERQQKLLEELEEENRLGVQREAKKARDAQKKKEKKAQQKQAKAEEKARKDADRAREEAELKAQEDKKLEDQRRRKEEQKKKKEAEKKAQDDERVRKEAEKQRRLQEQRDKLQEAERKVQEQKAQEKKIRDDAKRKEREEREAKEKEAREKKAHDEKARRDRDAKAKAEKEAKERARKEERVAHAQATQTATPSGKRAVQPVPVALPPGLLPRQPSTVASPQVQIATPALPKAPTPSRQRQASQQGSHGSSPKTPLVVPSLSSSISPTSNVPPTQSTGAPKQLLTKPLPLPASGIPNLQQQQPPNSPLQHLGPSGNFQPPLSGFGGGMPPGLNGFPNQSPLLPGIGQRPPGPNMPMFPMHPPNPLASQYRGFGPGGNLPPPPPGMGGQQMMPPHGQGFPMNIPPGFQAPLPGMGAPMPGPGFRDNLPPHSRQPSGSFDKSPFEAAPGVFPGVNPIQRPVPAPIQRPSSAKPHEDSHQLNSEIDDLSSHLGSKALLDDADDPIPPFHQGDLEPRRSSLQQGQPRMPFGNGQMFPTAPTRPRVESFGLGGSSGAGSAWSTPTNPFMSSASSMPSAGGWGSSPTGNRYGFGPVGQSQRSNVSRPVSIRLKAIQAYRDLSATTSSAQGFELNEILHFINLIPSPEAAVHPDELKAILETEGDAINGGGLFHLDDATPGQFIVKFEDGGDIGKGAPGLGEIGSPIPSHSVPVGSFSSGNGFGNPIGNRLFPNLGPS